MKTLMMFAVFFALSACGGGGDSSSGAGGTAPVSHAGTYNGFAMVTVSMPGLAPETVTGTIQIVIDTAGNVTSDPNTPFSGDGTLTGNSFTVMVPAGSVNQPGIACAGMIVITGTVSGNTTSGSISGDAVACNGVPVQISGTFEAARAPGPSQSRAASPVGDSLMESLRRALR